MRYLHFGTKSLQSSVYCVLAEHLNSDEPHFSCSAGQVASGHRAIQHRPRGQKVPFFLFLCQLSGTETYIVNRTVLRPSE